MNKINIGDKILDWTVLDNKSIKIGSSYKIKCQCKCGVIKLINRSNLIRGGYPKNCGCDKSPKNKELRNNLVGIIKNNTYGTPMKIIKYNNSKNIIIEFQDKYKFQKRIAMKEFNNGKVHNPFDKVIFGVGYYGFDYIPTSREGDNNFDRCYDIWYGMLKRCYDKKYQIKRPTYIGCTVCEEWHNFKTFSEWYFNNIVYFKNGDKTCLDKDILLKGNKIYSPQTCCFVPNEINCLFTKTNKIRGKYPIGVYLNKGKYIAQCNCGIGKQKIIGAFNNPTEAFYAYKKFKENYIKQVADKYKNEIAKNVYEAMYNYKVEITD